MKAKINNTIKTIQTTTEYFYQQKADKGFENMENTIVSIGQLVDELHQYKQEHSDFVFDENKVAQSLTEALEAMQKGDTVLLADILEYDFIEYLQEVEASL